MSWTRWKMMAGVLSASIGGLATVGGQCPKQEANKSNEKSKEVLISADPPALPQPPAPPSQKPTPMPSIPAPTVTLPTPEPMIPSAPMAIPVAPQSQSKSPATIVMPEFAPLPMPEKRIEYGQYKQPDALQSFPVQTPGISTSPMPAMQPAKPPANSPMPVLPAGGTVQAPSFDDLPAANPVTPVPPAVPVKPEKPSAPADKIPVGQSQASPLVITSSSGTVAVPLDPPVAITPPPAPAAALKPVVVPAGGVAAVTGRLRIVLRVGEGDPTFEIRNGDDLLLKVISEKVDIKSPEKGPGLSSVKATGKVHFVGFGAEGTCDELSFMAGNGEVALAGNVKIQVKDKLGRVESEMTTENVKYKIDASTIGGSLKP